LINKISLSNQGKGDFLLAVTVLKLLFLTNWWILTIEMKLNDYRRR